MSGRDDAPVSGLTDDERAEVARFAPEAGTMLVATVERIVAAREAAARAEAWDEGYDAAAWRSFRRTDISIGRADEANPPNPYRADAPAPREAERDAGVEHVVHVTAEPVAEDVVWCDECEEWVAASAPESAAENAPREGERDG